MSELPRRVILCRALPQGLHPRLDRFHPVRLTRRIDPFHPDLFPGSLAVFVDQGADVVGDFRARKKDADDLDLLFQALDQGLGDPGEGEPRVFREVGPMVVAEGNDVHQNEEQHGGEEARRDVPCPRQLPHPGLPGEVCQGRSEAGEVHLQRPPRRCPMA
jgi:hypothetical protein